jgi:hypothetical protein
MLHFILQTTEKYGGAQSRSRHHDIATCGSSPAVIKAHNKEQLGKKTTVMLQVGSSSCYEIRDSKIY